MQEVFYFMNIKDILDMDIYSNNKGEKFIFLPGYGYKHARVKFLATGSVRACTTDNAKRGKVRDLYAPSYYGKGYVGDHLRPVYWKQALQLWKNMLKRCYCKADTRGYYGRCIVSVRWLCFANFLNDLPKLPGFNDWRHKKDMQLDKDILGDSTVYDVSVCQFVPRLENMRESIKRRKQRELK